MQLRVAVPDEKVSAHQLEQLLCREMIAHVSKGHPRGNAQAARPGCQQRGFWYAESSTGAQAIAGSKVLFLIAPIVGIVENFITHGVVELHCARYIVARTSRDLTRKLLHPRVSAVNKLPRRHVLF